MSYKFKKSENTSITFVEDELQPKLEDLQRAVACEQCRFIEVVYLKDGRQMIVNEEGLIHHLERNPLASELAEKHIVGNVVVLAGTAKLT